MPASRTTPRERPARVGSLFLLLCCAAPLARAAALEGVALDNASGRPLARAHVTLYLLQQGLEFPLKTGASDSSGHFSFAGLAAGSYVVTAQREGFATAKYGQRRWNGAGAPVVLGDDGQFFAELRLRRLGAVTGHVWDENQVGLPGSTVYAYQVGREPLLVSASAVSDDRGVYRIAGLAPGEYHILTGARVLEDRRSLLPTFFGQDSGAAQARRVVVELESEVEHVDIQPLAGRLGLLRGQVTGGTAIRVRLSSEFQSRQVTPGPGGTFSFDQLAPGEYELFAVSAGAPVLAAYRKVTLGQGPAEVTLGLGPLPTVRVRAEVNGAGGFAPQQLAVWLKAKDAARQLTFAAPPLRVSPGGVTPVSPGEYVASAQVSPDYYVQSIRVSQAAQGHHEFTALPSQSIELVVTVSARPAKLEGKVTLVGGQPAASAPVFLRAADPELLSRLGGSRATRTGPDGSYEFSGLPPGEYQVFSSFDFEEPQEADWQAVPAKTVRLEESQQARLDLDLVGGL